MPEISSLENAEGAGRAGWPLHPGPCAKGICASARTTGTGGDHTGPPCAMVYGLWRALLGEPCRLPPSAAMRLRIVGISAEPLGRQDHTLSPSAPMPRLTASTRPPHSAPRSWRRVRPSCRRGTGSV